MSIIIKHPLATACVIVSLAVAPVATNANSSQSNILTKTADVVFDRSNLFVSNDNYRYRQRAYGRHHGARYEPYRYSGYRNPYGRIPRHYRRPYYYETRYYPTNRYQHYRHYRPTRHHYGPHSRVYRGQYTFWPTVTYYPAYRYYPPEYYQLPPPRYTHPPIKTRYRTVPVSTYPSGHYFGLCNAYYKGSYHPGALISKKCRIVYQGRAYLIGKYSVIRGSGYHWKYSKDGRIPRSAVATSYQNGKPVFACRTKYGKNSYPGQVIGKRCVFSYKNQIHRARQFYVLTQR